MVGLANVDNTSDANKPVSTAAQTALDFKAPLASPTFTGTPSLPTGTTGVTQSANDKSTKLATTAFVTSSVSAGAPDATSTATGKVQLAGDLGGTAAVPTVPGLALKANTTDVTNSLALKAPINNPTFTGTVGGITKAMIDLANVDNTSDANKPVSTAGQTALNLKAPLASPTLTGTPLAPTATAGNSSTQIATTEFVTGAITTANATNANLTGPITSSGNATSVASQTGTGSKFVMDTSPTLVTPTIGVATATSVNNVSITAPANGSTLTIADGKTLTSINSLTLSGTDATTMTFPSTNATLARTDAAQTFTGTQTFSSPIAGSITGNAATVTTNANLTGDVTSV
jgi:hypothetical protein